MKLKIFIFSIITSFVFFTSCKKAEVFPESKYNCSLSFPDETATHPKADVYQGIIDKYIAKGVLGTSIYIKDPQGEFLGVGGFADIASGVKIKPCNQFIIGSITKPITATVTFALIDDGILTLDDPMTKWLDQSITDRIPNGDEIQLKHLLSHRAGLPDHYDLPYYFDNLNQERNIQSQEDYLKYTFDKDPVAPVDSVYAYSNVGFVLMGMILESASGKKLSQLYQEKIFNKVNLTSGYYGAGDASIPEGLIKGYMDLNGNGELIESEFFYEEEMNTADGGICMNAQDLGKFFEEWHAGNIISPASVEAMKTWRYYPDNKPDDEDVASGYGIDKYETEFGDGMGHDGGVGGFSTIAQLYPESGHTFIAFFNSAPVKYNDEYSDFLKELRAEMFKN